jgi:carotenoid cleavage dioxygenase-like enzyme
MDQPSLPMEGSLPPDLQGMLFRAGPRPAWADAGSARAGAAGAADGEVLEPVPAGAPGGRGALHSIELRDGKAVSYLWHDSEADATVFWHAGSVLALPEAGLPSQYSRQLEPEEFAGGLTVPIASHVHRVASDGGRVLFAIDDGTGRPTPAEIGAEDAGETDEAIWLRIGEWDATGGLRTAQAVELERATWQHDVGITAGHVVFIESPTTRLGDAGGAQVPFGWVPGTEGWLGVVPRDGDGSRVRWFRLDPCLVTHVLGAWEATGRNGEVEIVLYVCRYDVPEPGQPVDLAASVVGPAGVGLSPIGGSLAVLERWHVAGDRLERTQVDERHVEYPRLDAVCEGEPFRYGYCAEVAWAGAADEVVPVGLLKFDLRRDELAAAWSPGPWRRASEPLFVRARDGHADDEGWLLTVVDDANTGTSDLYVLDATSMGRRGPEAVVHLPVPLPFRSHGEWVPADRYR